MNKTTEIVVNHEFEIKHVLEVEFFDEVFLTINKRKFVKLVAWN